MNDKIGFLSIFTKISSLLQLMSETKTPETESEECLRYHSWIKALDEMQKDALIISSEVVNKPAISFLQWRVGSRHHKECVAENKKV
jgi:hypothetical protein